MSTRLLFILLVGVTGIGFALGDALAPRRTPNMSNALPSKLPAPSAGLTPNESAATPAPPPAATSPAAPARASVEAVFDALGERTYGGRAYAVGQVIAQLDADQVEAVLAQLESVERFDQWHILPRAIDRLMQIAPERALGWLETNAPTYREGSTTFLEAFAMVAQRDLALARQFFEKLPPGTRRNGVAQKLLLHLAERSPAEAKALLDTLPKGAARELPVQGYVHGLARSDPDAAITQALTWNHSAAQRAALTAAFDVLGKASATRALGALERIKDDGLRGDLFEHLVAQASAAELPALAQAYERLSQTSPRFAELVDNVPRLAEGFARENPTAALAWAETLPPDARKEAHRRALYVWGYREPEKALAWAMENGADEAEKQRRVSIALGSWLDVDFSAACGWVEKMPAGSAKEMATQRIVWRHAARGDDTSAGQWLARVPEAARGELAGNIAADLAWKNPSHAASWLAHLEPDESSAPLFGRVAAQWAELDVRAAGSWVNGLPVGTVRDAAIGRFAREVASLDPATAADWAASASSEDAREALVPTVLAAWQERDPAAARRWLENATALSAERKARLLQLFQ